MKKALKELLEKAPVKLVGDFRSFMVISNDVYDGFWGRNGYNNIILLGSSCDGKWFRISEYADVFFAYDIRSLNVDISTEYGVPKFWFDQPIHIDYTLQTSSIMGSGLYPVTPQPKTGRWIDSDGDNAICSSCHRLNHLYGVFCKHCGSRNKIKPDAV